MSKSTTGTAEEKAIHKEAIRLRKMTDVQLVAAFREAKSGSTGQVKELIDDLAAGKCRRVGSATAGNIARYAREKGLI